MGSDWSGKQRYEDTLAYITDYVNANLAQHIRATLNGKVEEEEVGRGLSLGGLHFWLLGSKDQHRAVRALLLCQRTYLNGDTWSQMTERGATTAYSFASSKDSKGITKKACQSMTEKQVRRAVLAYYPTPRPEDLAVIALSQKNGSAGMRGMVWETFTRGSAFPLKDICYQVIPWWLFMAGFVSIRWLTRYECGMTANNVNDRLGRGILVAAGQDGMIPRGRLVNFHAVGNESVCHWAVSMGEGWAIGVNNTTASGGANTNFRRSGGSMYGEFEISSMRAVLQNKYTTGVGANVRQMGVEVLSIDPGAVASYI